jgi:biotin transport system substrate-specific component
MIYTLIMNTRKTLLIALFTGLIIVGTFIKVPLPPVPISLQTFFVILAGMIGGLQIGLFATVIYLLLGIIGLPVFSSGGGLAALIGPTGGYLVGMLLAVIVVGIFSDRIKAEDNKKKQILLCTIGGILGTLVIYAIGLPWLKSSLDWTWGKTLVGGMYPFLIGDFIKLIVALIITFNFKERFDLLISTEIEE